MKITDTETASTDAKDDISFRSMLLICWRKKLLVIAISSIFVFVGVLYALNVPNIYKSDALISPTTDNSGMNLPGQLGGLAALAGVNLGGANDNTAMAIEVASSREFLMSFIVKHDLLDELLAAENWDRKSGNLIYDEDIYSAETRSWVRDPSPPFDVIPTPLEGYRQLLQLLNIYQDSGTGFVRISIEHVSPVIAQYIVENLIYEINSVLKEREVSESEKSIKFLRNEVSKTENSDAKSMLFSLIEEQMKNLMLANVRDEFVFKVIDRPIVPDKKHSPARALIVLLSAFLGFFVSVFVVVLMHVYRT